MFSKKEKQKNRSALKGILLSFITLSLLLIPISFSNSPDSSILGGFEVSYAHAWIDWSAGVSMILATVSNAILGLMAWGVGFAGLMFDYVIDETVVKMGTNVKNIDAINIAWTAIRDVANMAFIFILIYIAIATILRLSNVDTKKALINVIVIALLINFSMFLTKVVIDATNFVAIGFYNASTNVTLGNGEVSESLSQSFAHVMGLSGIFSGESVVSVVEKGGSVTGIIVSGVGGSILLMITMFVFLAGAFLFFMRYIMLLFLMILSPIAFVALAMPQSSGLFKKWSGSLINQSVFAPAFLILIYISLLITSEVIGAGTSVTYDEIFSNPDIGTWTGGGLQLFFNYAIISGFLIGSLILAKQFGTMGAGHVNSFGKKWAGRLAGGATLGTAGRLGRGTFGRFGKALYDSKRLKGKEKEGSFGATTLRQLGSYTSKKSFDGRSVAGGTLGQAQKGGHSGDIDRAAKRDAEWAKDLGPSSEEKDEMEREIENAEEEIEEKNKELEDARSKGDTTKEKELISALSELSDQLKKAKGEKDELLGVDEKEASNRAQKEIDKGEHDEEIDKLKGAKMYQAKQQAGLRDPVDIENEIGQEKMKQNPDQSKIQQLEKEKRDTEKKITEIEKRSSEQAVKEVKDRLSKAKKISSVADKRAKAHADSIEKRWSVKIPGTNRHLFKGITRAGNARRKARAARLRENIRKKKPSSEETIDKILETVSKSQGD